MQTEHLNATRCSGMAICFTRVGSTQQIAQACTHASRQLARAQARPGLGVQRSHSPPAGGFAVVGSMQHAACTKEVTVGSGTKHSGAGDSGSRCSQQGSSPQGQHIAAASQPKTAPTLQQLANPRQRTPEVVRKRVAAHSRRQHELSTQRGRQCEGCNV